MTKKELIADYEKERKRFEIREELAESKGEKAVFKAMGNIYEMVIAKAYELDEVYDENN